MLKLINVNEVKNKVLNGKELTEREIDALISYEWADIIPIVEELSTFGATDHRWYEEKTSIVDIDGRFFAVDWQKGLTEDCEDEYPHQPVEVRKTERDTVCVKTTYERISDCKTVALLLKLKSDVQPINVELKWKGEVKND